MAGNVEVQQFFVFLSESKLLKICCIKESLFIDLKALCIYILYKFLNLIRKIIQSL
jgi:hypothetical protein